MPGIRDDRRGRLRNPTREEAALAAKLQGRDESAIGEIEALYGNVIGGFLRDSLGDRASAEEVRQQVLLEIWKRGPDYQLARSSVLTWVMVIARSRALDERRKRRPEPVDPTTVDGAAEPDPELDRLLERWRLTALLERIPAEEAEVLRLRFDEDLSQTMIVDRLEVPLGTVKTRMVRGLARLRELIAEEEEER
jgi:RNA polymerase sigma-70 factor (ECF subfamily)